MIKGIFRNYEGYIIMGHTKVMGEMLKVSFVNEKWTYFNLNTCDPVYELFGSVPQFPIALQVEEWVKNVNS